MQTCENWAQKRAFRREFIKIKKKNILRHQKNSIFSLGSTAFFPLRRNPRRMMIPRKKWILNWKLENIFILRHIESIVVAIKEWFPIMKSSLHQSIDFRLLKRKPKSRKWLDGSQKIPIIFAPRFHRLNYFQITRIQSKSIREMTWAWTLTMTMTFRLWATSIRAITIPTTWRDLGK